MRHHWTSMRALAMVLLTGLVLATVACTSPSPDASATPSVTSTVDDPWPGRHRYTSTAVKQGGQQRRLEGVAFIEMSLLEVGRVSVYAGCKVITMSARLNGGRMLVSDMSITKIGCSPQQQSQDRWLLEFFIANPSVSSNGLDLTLTDGDTVITLRPDLSPS